MPPSRTSTTILSDWRGGEDCGDCGVDEENGAGVQVEEFMV